MKVARNCLFSGACLDSVHWKYFWAALWSLPILLLLVGGQPLQARSLPLHFEHIGLEQGLSQSTVMCILEDHRGFLWFCTEGGLNRYDGYNFTVFKADGEDENSLSSNSVYTLHEDRSGALWAGTNGGGLNRLDPSTQKFTHYRHTARDNTSLVSDSIRSLATDSQGRLWVATIDGLDRLDPGRRSFVHYRNRPGDPTSLSANRVNSLFIDRDGHLWVGTEAGLDRYDPHIDGFVHHRHDPLKRNGLADRGIIGIVQERSGALWIGTAKGGLEVLDPRTGQFKRFVFDPRNPNSLSSNRVWSLYIDRDDNLWVGTEAGLNHFDRTTSQFTRYRHDENNPRSLGDDIVYSLFEDRSGVLWVGTFSQGVNRLGYKAEKFAQIQHVPGDPQSLTGGAVSSLAEGRDGNLWVGFWSSGFDRYNPHTQKAEHYLHDPLKANSLSDNSINAIYEDRNGILWIGTDSGGLNRFDPASGRFTRYQHDPGNPFSLGNNSIYSLLEDRSGQLWIGTKTDLERFDRRTGKFTRYRHQGLQSLAQGDNVFAIREDRSGYLWLAIPEAGLDRFDPRTGRFRHYRHRPEDPASLSDDKVWSIYEDKKGALWFGTDNGINRLDPQTEKFEHFNEKNGLINNVGCAVLGDGQGDLWIATSRGLSRYTPSSRTFRNFDLRDGLQSKEFNAGAAVVGRGGKLYFGGVNGINVVEPARVLERTYLPPVVLTRFSKFARPVTLTPPIWKTQTLNLSYADSVFSLEYAALDYVAPEKNRYRYRMEGFDRDWVDAGYRREVTYTNLDPGTYRFEVQGTNSDGRWSNSDATLTIVISPPLWKTPWAYASYAILALGTLFGFVRNRTEAQTRELEQQRQVNQLLEHKVDERTAELQLATQRAEQARQRVELLNRITAQVRDSLEETQILQTAVDELAVSLDLRRCHAGLYDPDHQLSTITCEYAGTSVAMLGKSIAMDRMAGKYASLCEGRTLQFSIFADELTGNENETTRMSVLAVPIVDDQEVLGDLWLFRQEDQRFGELEIRLVQQVANQCAIALRQARLYETLQEQVSELERLNRLKDDFLDSVSHELRTPLTSIKVSVQLLEGMLKSKGLLDAGSGRIVEYFRILKNECQREIELVNDLLDLSRLEADILELDPIALDLQPWILNVVEPYTVRAIQNNQILKVDLPESLPRLITDPAHLGRILAELLNNACKYTPAGETISVTARSTADGLLLSVTNTGVEISRQEQERIFQKFYRIPNSDPWKHGGTGLGLALVRKLVLRLGGTVEVESNNFQTTFQLRFAPSAVSLPVEGCTNGRHPRT